MPSALPLKYCRRKNPRWSIPLSSSRRKRRWEPARSATRPFRSGILTCNVPSAVFCRCRAPAAKNSTWPRSKEIEPVVEILVMKAVNAENEKHARVVQTKLRSARTLMVNLLSGPRAGKTRLLEQTLSQVSVSYTHLRAHETRHDLVCRLLLEKK